MMSAFLASLLILNGEGTNEPQSREAVNLLHDEGIDIYVRVTREEDDVVRFIDEALQLNVETVITGGGDGTINEMATAPVEYGSKMALGILSLGTVSDFATSVGTSQDLTSVLKLAIAGRDVSIDITRVSDKTGFINVTTGGLGTRATTETPGKLKVASDGVSYLIHGLMRMDIPKLDRYETRGENFHWQGDMLVIGIGNDHQAGGGQQLCPKVLINDGLLRLCTFTGEEPIPALLSTLANSESSPNIADGVSSWLETTAPHKMTSNLGGESLSGKTFHTELLPAALRCRLPLDCPPLR